MLLVATEKDEDPASALSPQNAPGEMPESSYTAFVPHSPPEKRGLAEYVLLAYSFSSLLFVFREDRERGEREREKAGRERTIDLKPRIGIPHDALTRPSQRLFASFLGTSAVDGCRAGPDVDVCKAQFLVLAF